MAVAFIKFMRNACKIAGVSFYLSRDVIPDMWLRVMHNKSLIYPSVLHGMACLALVDLVRCSIVWNTLTVILYHVLFTKVSALLPVFQSYVQCRTPTAKSPNLRITSTRISMASSTFASTYTFPSPDMLIPITSFSNSLILFLNISKTLLLRPVRLPFTELDVGEDMF